MVIGCSLPLCSFVVVLPIFRARRSFAAAQDDRGRGSVVFERIALGRRLDVAVATASAIVRIVLRAREP